MTEPSTTRSISVEINGETYSREVEARKLLVHLIRDDLDLTGTHIGCDTGSCGACTVHVNGLAVKSGMLLAVQADGATIDTIEGLAAGDELGAAAGVLRQACAAVRLLHPRDADERLRPARGEPAPLRARDQGSDPGQHLPLHRLLEHRRGRAERGGGGCTLSTTAPTETTVGRIIGTSVPRKEDRRLVQGQGVFTDADAGLISIVGSPRRLNDPIDARD